MAHHKRRRPKHQRAGCLQCKPWKDERIGRSRKVKETTKSPPRDQRRLQDDDG